MMHRLITNESGHNLRWYEQRMLSPKHAQVMEDSLHGRYGSFHGSLRGNSGVVLEVLAEAAEASVEAAKFQSKGRARARYGAALALR